MVSLGDLSTDEVVERWKEADKFLKVKFFPQRMLMGFKSKQAGKDVYEEVDFINITIPGQTQNTNIFKVRNKPDDVYKMRFPLQWAAYKIDKDQELTGTPIEALPSIGHDHIMICKQHNINTIEQLVKLPMEYLTPLGADGLPMVTIGKEFLRRNIENESTNNNAKSSKKNGATRKSGNSGRKQQQVRRKNTRAAK